jgi:Putative peptidoglycan binding domain
VTQSGWGSAGPQETAVWPPRPAPERPREPADAPGVPPWEVDLRDDAPEGRYRPRRELRGYGVHPTPGPSSSPTSGPTSGPTTQELAVYRGQPAARPARPDRLAPWDDQIGRGEPAGRRERAKRSVESWSRWASGLGLPARDGSGYARYARAERLLPPAVWIAVGLGVAGLVGLLTGVLVSAPSSGGPATATATATATVTVTQQVTQAPVTETTTRVRTKTVTTTTTAAPTDAGGGNGAGGALAPGAQGPQVARLQAALALLGLYQGRPTGTYDEPTRAAVQAFQAQAGVTGDPPGVAGPATLAALAQAVGR